MSHNIYNTEAFVVSSSNTGESDKYFHLFTKEHGLILAKATGIRKIESKLRYVAQDYAHLDVSLVKGRVFWRLVSARNSHKDFDFKNKDKLFVRIKAMQLLKKICPQEEAHPNLFIELDNAFSFVNNLERSAGELKAVESLLVLKMLNSFGYWGEEDDFISSPFTHTSINNVIKDHKNIIKELNKSLKATQLI